MGQPQRYPLKSILDKSNSSTGMENEKHNPDTKSQSQVAGTGATQTPGKDVLYGATSPQGSSLSPPPRPVDRAPNSLQMQAPPTLPSWII